jgi:phosphatidylglycerophosphate synthase
LNYKEIRRDYQNHNYEIYVDRYATILSPFITKVLIKLKLIPNKVTVLMMVSGVIGAGLFSIPNIIFKIIGVAFIHLWYILDCSDGEIARITKKYSKFGTEIDFTAHILNHPLINLAFVVSLIQTKRYNSIYLLIVFMIFISLELIFRNILCFNKIYSEKINTNFEELENSESKKLIKNRIKKFITNVTLYPNYALLFPICYIVDYYLKLDIAYYYSIITVIFFFIVISGKSVSWIQKILYK